MAEQDAAAVHARADALEQAEAALALEREHRRKLEEELRESHRLEVVGQLAGGVAHDFNNLLTAIRGFAELIPAHVADESARRYANEIIRAADQAAALTHQLLAFSRRRMTQPRELELNTVVDEMLEVLRRLIGEAVELRVELAAEHSWVRADPGELEQVVLNLALNARDAMPEGGLLTISTADAGDRVRLEVRDCGTGMDPDTIAHAFEPFYTTKPLGQGTGLGLSTVYGVCERSGGRVDVVSTPGEGSTFIVELPVVPAPAAVVVDEPPPVAARPCTVLLVEDSESVRTVTRAMLEGSGYRVLDAADGPSALEVLHAHLDEVDLLLTDVVMPGMDGRRLAATVRDEAPDIPVVFMSGYAERGGAAGLDTPRPLLVKPFTSDALLTQIRDAVAGVHPRHPGAEPPTVVVADDHPSVLTAIAERLAVEGFEVVGQARDGERALELIASRRPRLAVVDVRMPGVGGLEVARRASSGGAETAVVLYSGFPDQALAREALAAGAKGVVLKDGPLAELARALRRVLDGELAVDPRLDELAPDPTVPHLTPREADVLRLVAEGFTNAEIASRLSISSETVQTHVRKAMARLGADSRTQAVAQALRLELIS